MPLTDLATALAALLRALDAEEAHARQLAPANDTRRYCHEAQALRETVRQLRREAVQALKRQEDAA